MSVTINALLVGGGSGGGAGCGGGGGAGQVVPVTITLTDLLSVVLGAAGAGAPGGGSNNGANGGNTSIGSYTALGGGGGGAGGGNPNNGLSGACGGGGGGYHGGVYTSGGAGTNGNAGGGGSGSGPDYSAGGGGGNGTAGATGTNTTGGNGGDGVASAITGSTVYYGAGGGGACGGGSGTPGTGGNGGGGTGSPTGTGANATGYGSGGGGGAYNNGYYGGGNGSSGIAIVSFPAGSDVAYTGTYTIGSDGAGNTVWTLTSPGVILLATPSSATSTVFQRMCPLTLNGSLVSETGTYAVLFDGSGDAATFGTRLPDELFILCQANGGDLYFTLDAQGTARLPTELVWINTATKQAEIWVAAPLIAGTDRTIYVWYASTVTLTQPAASAPYGANAAWDAVGNMCAVYHFGTPSTWSGLDSTRSGNNIGGGTTAAGLFGGGVAAGGGSYTGSVYQVPVGGEARTFQTWIKVTSGGAGAIGGWGANPNLNSNPFTGSRWDHYYTSSPSQLQVETEGQAAVFNWTTDSNWHAMVSVNPPANTNQNNILMYLDGASQTVVGHGAYGDTFGTSSASIAIASIPGYFGGPFPGLIDEFRISSAARSANYLATDFAAQKSTVFVTVGTPVSVTLVAASTVAPTKCLRTCALTINGSLVAESNTYAVLFDGSGDTTKFGVRLPDELFTLCQANGGDICFTSDAAGLKSLPMELVSIDTAAKTAEIWSAMRLVAGSNVTVYVWYQSSSGVLSQPAATSALGAQAVWNGFLGIGGGDGWAAFVSHDGGQTDSTGNTTPTPSLVFPITGQIGGACNFNPLYAQSSNVTISNQTILNTSNAWTMQIWEQWEAVNDYYQLIRLGQSGSTEFTSVIGKVGSSGLVGNTVYCGFRGYAAFVSTSATYAIDNNQGSWHQHAITYNGGGVTTLANFNYVIDGTPVTLSSFSAPGGGSGAGIVIGLDSNGGGQLIGNTDEARITIGNRSANYLATDFNIQSSTSFITVGTPAAAAASTPTNSLLVLPPVRREQFKNLAATTLASNIAATDTVITVTNGALLPGSGDFRLIVGSEIMLCANIVGNVLTVLRGMENTTAAEHVSGATVAHVLTQGSLTALLQDNVPYAGSLQRPFRLVDGLGNPLTLANFGVIAQVGGGFVRQVGSGIEVTIRYGNGNYYGLCLTRPLPASSQVTACVTGLSTTWGSLADVGLGLMNLASFQEAAGSGGNARVISCWFGDQTKLTVAQWLATNSRSGVPYSANFSTVSRLWLQVRLNGDGTSSYCASADGMNWTLIYTYAATSPALDTVFFWTGTDNNAQESGTLLAWDEGA